MNVDSVWMAMLSKLERDAERAEKALSEGELDGMDEAPWIPPEMTDALPAHLVPRATDLARRQQALISRLKEATSAARREERALGRWSAHPHRPAVYVDQST